MTFLQIRIQVKTPVHHVTCEQVQCHAKVRVPGSTFLGASANCHFVRHKVNKRYTPSASQKKNAHYVASCKTGMFSLPALLFRVIIVFPSLIKCYNMLQKQTPVQLHELQIFT